MILVSASLLLAGTSCVSKKKYLEAENGRIEAEKEAKNLRERLIGCQDESDRLVNQVAALAKDTALLRRDIRNYKTMLNTNMGEQDKLNALLSEKMKELDEREQTINQLQEMIDEQTRKVQDLLNSVKEALLGFNSDELTVTEKNGKVYVAMSDKLLFQSGSATVDKRGKEALAKLADVLNKQNDIDVYIEGHTDSKPIHNARFSDNWDLSVIRATSVVRILTTDYGVNPLQIQPCAEGRSKNRRTEIIMAPRLDKLIQMLQ